MYNMLCGYFPFIGKDHKEIEKAITKGKLKFPAYPWDRISGEATDLVRELLNRDF